MSRSSNSATVNGKAATYTGEEPFVQRVTFTPTEDLEFVRKDGAFVPSQIIMENTSNGAVVFKVKTTKPQKYLVKPNQGVIEAGKTATVVINLHQREWNPNMEKESSGDKFKVETARYPAFEPGTPKEKADEDLVAIFKSGGTADNPLIARKLKCKFVNDGDLPIAESSSGDRMGAENLDTPNKIFDEYSKAMNLYKDLRKRYDKVVEYTVKLTAERDDLIKRLQEETNKNSMLAAKVGKIGASDDKAAKVGAEAAVSVGGISFFYAILIALVCFLLGRVIN